MKWMPPLNCSVCESLSPWVHSWFTIALGRYSLRLHTQTHTRFHKYSGSQRSNCGLVDSRVFGGRGEERRQRRIKKTREHTLDV